MNGLRRFTPARVGLGRAGNSIPTSEMLNFQLAHARARDAVHHSLDIQLLSHQIETEGWPVITAKSAARNRAEYLRRPDLGRILAPGTILKGDYDLVFIVADGLSARTLNTQAVAFLRHLIPQAGSPDIAPVVIVEQGRVAIGDEIGARYKASLSVVLIGERPGLSSPDSMGLYLTWNPQPGRTDAERNCISNIRPAGLSVPAAAQLAAYLISEARSRKLSGIALKAIAPPNPDRNKIAP